MKLRYERGALEAIAARIAELPRLGDVTRNSRFRQFAVGNYLLVDEVAKEQVIIHYVRHGARRRPWEG
jgi:plasmid stabilization system protein ParE